MSRHRAINLALAFVLIALLSYVGPSLDDSKALIGAFGIVQLDPEVVPFSGWELLLFWVLIIFLVVCTLVVIGAGFAIFANWMGWLK